jgi:hypothetical protein
MYLPSYALNCNERSYSTPYTSIHIASTARSFLKHSSSETVGLVVSLNGPLQKDSAGCKTRCEGGPLNEPKCFRGVRTIQTMLLSLLLKTLPMA